MGPESEKKVHITDEQVEDYNSRFAANLKNLRDERGLKRDWVAKRLGVHYNTLKNWELGKAHPGTREILALAEMYHIEPSEIFKGI